MSRRNYFEILDLDFDPPESDERSIKKAIKKWEMNLQDMLANEANVSKRNILNAELGLYSDIVNVMNDKKKRNTEARELKLYRVAQLEKLIDIMLVGRLGTPEVTNAMIRNVSLKLKLSTETVESTYINKGFVIQKKIELIKLNDYFLTTVINDEINMLIKKFNSIVIPGYPWTSKVHDLFDLACFYSGGSDSDLTNFKHKRTKEIYNIMEAGSINFATEMSGRGHIFSDLFTKGTTQIFNSESNRKKYERSIEREKLKSFFAMLKSAPEEFKRDKYFAESCIKTIQKSFVDFNLSLALYNNEAGLTHEPYEPIEAVIHVTCPSCKASMEFGTSKEAENGKCAACGTKLYVTCPKCDKKVPAFADWCSCGFHISEMKFFDEYYKAAELALKEMNLLEAQRQFANAQNAYPKNPKLITLNKLIKDETDKYEKPLNELKSLMESGKYCSAQKLIDTISTSMPQLNLDTQRKLINDKLSDAKKMMPHLSLPTSVRANRCVEILESIKDYQPAMDVLKTCPPNAPLNLHGTVKTGNGLVCSLTWNVSEDKGISYCVVRKKNGVPQRYSDGDVLSFNISTTEFNDKSIQPGISYGYAVFAYRQGVYSNPATYVVENFSDLDSKSVRAIADNGVCRFSWILPENCIGVRILKGFNSIPSYIPDSNCSVIAEQAITHFEDNAVENDKNYGYRLQCVYLYNNSFKYSQGYTLILKPEPPPTAVKNVTTKLEGRTVIVKWINPDTKPSTVIIKEVSFEIVHDMIGQIIPMSDINSVMGNGKTYSNIVSTVQRCQFDIPQNTSLSLAIIVLSGTKGIISEVVQVSSVEKCEINKKETRIEGNKLKIILKQKPKNLQKIHYIVNEKISKKVPWATIENAKKNMLQVVTADTYDKDGMILVESPPKNDIYISVIGQYKLPGGNIVYSDVSKFKICNKPKQKINYRLEWGGVFGRRARDCKLLVSTNASETPVLKLVYRPDGHIPMDIADPQLIVLHTVEESDNGFPNGHYSYIFPNSTWDNIRTGTNIRLILSDEDMTEYEVVSEDITTLIVPPR